MNSRSIIAICASILILATLCYCVAGIFIGLIYDDIEGFNKITVLPYGSSVEDGGWWDSGWIMSGSDIYMDDYGDYKFHTDDIISTPRLRDDKWRSNRALLLSLRKWAEDNEATVLVASLNAGIGICDYSGWLDSALDPAIVERLNNSERGVYVSDDASFQTAYVKDGMFMPETIAIPILGTFSSTDENLDKLILERKYLYPLIMNAGSQTSEYSFYARGGDADELVELFKEKGFLVKEVKYSKSWKYVFEQLLKVPKFDSLFIQASRISIVFCFIFTFLMYYRGIFASVKVNRRFGLSKLRLLGECVLTALVVAGGAMLLLGVYLISGISTLSSPNLYNFLPILGAGVAVFSVLIGLCGYGILIFKLNREVG